MTLALGDTTEALGQVRELESYLERVLCSQQTFDQESRNVWILEGPMQSPFSGLFLPK